MKHVQEKSIYSSSADLLKELICLQINLLMGVNRNFILNVIATGARVA